MATTSSTRQPYPSPISPDSPSSQPPKTSQQQQQQRPTTPAKVKKSVIPPDGALVGRNGRFRLEKTIGQGTYGKVKLATDLWSEGGEQRVGFEEGRVVGGISRWWLVLTSFRVFFSSLRKCSIGIYNRSLSLALGRDQNNRQIPHHLHPPTLPPRTRSLLPQTPAPPAHRLGLRHPRNRRLHIHCDGVCWRRGVV